MFTILNRLFKITLLSYSLIAQALTLPTTTLQAYDCPTCESLSHESLITQWPLQVRSLDKTAPLHEQSSKQYSIKTTAKELAQGVVLSTFAPGAVIRIDTMRSPQNVTKIQNRTATGAASVQFYIKTKQSGLIKLIDAAENHATTKSLASTEFTENAQLIVQLKPTLGFGQFILSADQPIGVAANTPYLIQVFDKNAEAYLTIKTNRSSYYHGDNLTTTIHLADPHRTYPAETIKANLVNPQGRRTPLTLTPSSDHHYTAVIPLTNPSNSLGRNWSIETEASTTVNNKTLIRHAHTAFSYAINSASIQEVKSNADSPSTITATIEVATSSRYALQAVLLTLDEHGKKIPLEMAQTAAWLTPGTHDMILSFSPDLITNHSGPLYLSTLELIDYGQIKPVFKYNKLIPISEL